MMMRTLGFWILVSASIGLATTTLGGCGSDAKSGSPPGNGGVAPDRTSQYCAKKELILYFSPTMHSAFDGVHTFKVPAAVGNVDPSTVEWKTSDSTMLDFENDPAVGGVMIAVHKAGEAVITATAGGLCGASMLKVTAASPDDWTIGSMRYNNGIKLVGDVGGGRGRQDAGPPMMDVACTNCHGDTATMGPYKTVAHTPMQTGGFSDEDLIGIFTMGKVPVGGYFDDSFVSYDRWRDFHKWSMSPAEAKGVVVYLRSLTPQVQGGMRGDFGGRGDGGRGDGGGGGGGGGNRPADAGAPSPADASASD